MRNLISLLLCICCVAGNAQVTFSLQITPTQKALTGISFADSLTGYACGDAGTIIYTNDGGVNWQNITTNIFDNLWDIKVIPGSAGQKVIAVGENNTIIKSIDAGATWISQTVPFQAGSFVFGVQCLDSLTYFACGGDFATFSGAVLKTTNGGNTWTKANAAGSVFLDKIFMKSLTKGFVAGTGSSFTNGGISRTTNGTTWISAKTSNSLLTNVWCPGSTNVISVGLGGQIWKSVNSGNTWTNQATSSVDLYGICFSDSLKGFVCGGSAAGSLIMSTNDGGNTWATNSTYTLGQQLTAVCISQGKVYIAGGNGAVLKAWQPYTPPPPPVTTSLNKITANNRIQLNYHHTDKFLRINNLPVASETEIGLNIYNVNGGLIWSKKSVYNQEEINAANFTSGIYYFRFTSGHGIINTGKVLVH